MVNGKQSESLSVKYGVPKGFLSLFFAMNVDDMPNAAVNHLDLFADDSTGHVIGQSPDIVINKLQTDLNKLTNFPCNNSLTIHSDKCQAMILSRINPLARCKIFP